MGGEDWVGGEIVEMWVGEVVPLISPSPLPISFSLVGDRGRRLGRW